MAEEYKTPLERYRSKVRILIDDQYDKWNNSILNTPNKIQRKEVTDNLRGCIEVEDFINICNFLEKHEQQEYLEGKKGLASKGTDDKENTFRDFLIFLFSRKQVIDELDRVSNLEPIDLHKVIESEKSDVKDAINETIDEQKENPNHLEELKIDMNFLEEKKSNLDKLSEDDNAKNKYISENPILNFFISEEQRPSLVKKNLVDDANLPDDIANLISYKYVLETDLKPAQTIPTNLKRKHENDNAVNAVNAFNRRKSKKASRRKSKKASRRKSKKASRRKSKKASRRKSKKASRRKSKKASRRKSKKASRRKFKKSR